MRLQEGELPFVSEGLKEFQSARAIFFIVGGATYEEAKIVDQFNKYYYKHHAILGGSNIINYTEFVFMYLFIRLMVQICGRASPTSRVKRERK